MKLYGRDFDPDQRYVFPTDVLRNWCINGISVVIDKGDGTPGTQLRIVSNSMDDEARFPSRGPFATLDQALVYLRMAGD